MDKLTELLAGIDWTPCAGCKGHSKTSPGSGFDCHACHGWRYPGIRALVERQGALLALLIDRLQEAGGTLDEKLRRQIITDLQQDIRQGGEVAAQWWIDERADLQLRPPSLLEEGVTCQQIKARPRIKQK